MSRETKIGLAIVLTAFILLGVGLVGSLALGYTIPEVPKDSMCDRTFVPLEARPYVCPEYPAYGL